ncbi:uncharacterized protein METZ01_LOCUS232829 [marine metagenome]|uniref:Uncharacterized protein n=1 Tax=marine metagenome TaxID=408172 RepID=A0A382GYQ7_9ZZZZ
MCVWDWSVLTGGFHDIFHQLYKDYCYGKTKPPQHELVLLSGTLQFLIALASSGTALPPKSIASVAQ